MKPLYLYWIHKSSPSTEIIPWLQSTLETPIDIEWGSEASLITIANGSAEIVAQLISLNDVIIHDFPGEVCLYLTPRIDLFFESQASLHNQSGIHDLGRIVMQRVQEDALNSEVVKMAFPELTKEHKDTVIAYLWSGFNASLAARILYLHRNSYTYRLNQMINSSGWEIRYAHVVLFLIWWLYL